MFIDNLHFIQKEAIYTNIYNLCFCLNSILSSLMVCLLLNMIMDFLAGVVRISCQVDLLRFISIVRILQ